MLSLLLTLSGAHAAPDAASLEAAWAARVPAIAADGILPLPALEPDTWAALAGGEVVKLRVDEADGVDRAVGLAWLPHSADAVWIAVLDDTHDTLVSGLTEHQLPGTTPGRKILYQHLDLPAPFQDRHWVLRIENTSALFPSGVWERVWTLDARSEPALTDRPAAVADLEGIWTPRNEGGWWLLPLHEGTLAVYQVRSDIGGAIPDELVVRYAMSTLDEMMEHIDQRAGEIPAHYDHAHFAILRPDGQPVAGWPRDAP